MPIFVDCVRFQQRNETSAYSLASGEMSAMVTKTAPRQPPALFLQLAVGGPENVVGGYVPESLFQCS